jgi:hypothetical protein
MMKKRQGSRLPTTNKQATDKQATNKGQKT